MERCAGYRSTLGVLTLYWGNSLLRAYYGFIGVWGGIIFGVVFVLLNISTNSTVYLKFSEEMAHIGRFCEAYRILGGWGGGGRQGKQETSRFAQHDVAQVQARGNCV